MVYRISTLSILGKFAVALIAVVVILVSGLFYFRATERTFADILSVNLGM